MRAGAIQPERDQVAFRDRGDQLDVRIREPAAHVVEHDPDEPARAVHVAQRAVRDEVVVDDAPHGGFVASIDRGDQRLHYRLVRHGLSSLRCPAMNVLDSLRTARSWINYGPGPPFDFVAGAHPATEAQLTEELGRLYAAGFRGLVTNTVAFGLERAPEIAKQIGFDHVVAKLWWQDDELLAAEKANLDAVIDAVDAVCVGNEIIQKGIADHDRLVREVYEARERYGRPVTTGFQPPDWQYFPDLATAIGDFSFLNVHPWWVLHRNDPLTAAKWVAEA